LNKGLLRDINSKKLVSDFGKTISPVKGIISKFLERYCIDIWSPKWTWLCASVRLASPSSSLITFQFHPLVVSLSEFSESAGTCFHVVYTPHTALKGLKEIFV